MLQVYRMPADAPVDAGELPLPDDVEYALRSFAFQALPTVLDDANRIFGSRDLYLQAITLGQRDIDVIFISDIRREATVSRGTLSIEQLRQLHLKARDMPVNSFYTLHKPDQSTLTRCEKNLQELGFCVPLLIDDENNVVMGENYLYAAQSIGMSTVPAVRMRDLSPAEAALFLKWYAGNSSRAADISQA